MKARREQIQVFGLSFLDVLACALGMVLLLLLFTLDRVHDEGQQYQTKLGGLENKLAAAVTEADEAGRRQREAEEAFSRENADRKKAQAERDATMAARRRAEAGQEEAERESDAAMAASEIASRQRDEANRGRRQAEADRDSAREELASARQRLSGVIGLRGDLQHVVFVFDTSASLGSVRLPPNADADTLEVEKKRKLQRFEEYKGLLMAWIQGIDFQEFNVVRFNTAVDVWKKGTLVDGTIMDNRTAACSFIDEFEPSGTTNTIGAIQAAFALPGVDTIILYSDGQPNDPNNQPIPREGETAQSSRTRSQAAIEAILKYVRENNFVDGQPKIAINTVAMGDYLDEDYGRFLQRLANDNGGRFIGM